MDSEKKLEDSKIENTSGSKPGDGQATGTDGEDHALKPDQKQNEPSQPTAGAPEAKTPVKEEGKKSNEASHLHVGGTHNQMEEKEDFDDEESNQNWNEYRVTGNAPTRRGYQASFVHDNYLYVHGGHDIREGTLDTMYKINLDPSSNDNEWEQINQRGIDQPRRIAYHTMTMYEDMAYLFGGSDLGRDNSKLFSFDIETSEWKVISDLSKATDTHPETRDEHAAVLWNDTIVIFGGNVQGFKSNDVWFYHIKENRWEEVKADSSPPERSNHAYGLVGDTLYIFGGKDIENNKMKDLWAFDCNSKTWSEIEPKGNDIPI